MQKITRERFNKFLNRQAMLNNQEVDTVCSKFTVEPSIQQKLEEKVKQESDFLRRIGSETVDQMVGEKIGIGISSTIAGRTYTAGNKSRKAKDISSLSKDEYRLYQTNYDTQIRYEKLDAWAHDPAFQKIYTAAISKQIARDRLMIGFNGTAAQKDTDRAANSLLQDVNIGWLAQLRKNKTAAVMTGVTVAETGTYKTLDAAAYDALHTLIAEHHRHDPEMVCIVGSELLKSKIFGLLNDFKKPTETAAMDLRELKSSIAGMPAMVVPYFPSKSVLITPLKNLAYYSQRGSVRRAIVDTPAKDCIIDYRSVNEGYVVEDYDAAALIEFT